MGKRKSKKRIQPVKDGAEFVYGGHSQMGTGKSKVMGSDILSKGFDAMVGKGKKGKKGSGLGFDFN